MRNRIVPILRNPKGAEGSNPIRFPVYTRSRRRLFGGLMCCYGLSDGAFAQRDIDWTLELPSESHCLTKSNEAVAGATQKFLGSLWRGCSAKTM